MIPEVILAYCLFGDIDHSILKMAVAGKHVLAVSKMPLFRIIPTTKLLDAVYNFTRRRIRKLRRYKTTFSLTVCRLTVNLLGDFTAVAIRVRFGG